MPASSACALLIVNADDYGYFRCVSRGILKAASEGIVTATGMFANGAGFAECAAWLRDHEALDAGVHLNLTEGTPLTSELRRKLARTSGNFPRKFAMARAILSGAIEPEAIRREWRAQIERCLGAGLSVAFLNSHEHLHMLPPLFSLASELAREYAIPHVRFPTSRLAGNPFRPAFVRAAIVKALETIDRRRADIPAPRFLGLESSGRLDPRYLAETLPRLRPGEIYELMCHPGEFDPGEVRDPRLRRYHDWEGELRTLTDPVVRDALRQHGIRLVGYRHLEIRSTRLVARPGLA